MRCTSTKPDAGDYEDRRLRGERLPRQKVGLQIEVHGVPDVQVAHVVFDGLTDKRLKALVPVDLSFQRKPVSLGIFAPRKRRIECHPLTFTMIPMSALICSFPARRLSIARLPPKLCVMRLDDLLSPIVSSAAGAVKPWEPLIMRHQLVNQSTGKAFRQLCD